MGLCGRKMTRTDRLANALEAVGCPDPRPVAVLTLEVLDEIGDDLEPMGARLTAIRGARYGTPDENFSRIAHLWEPILGVEVTPQQVGLAMIAVKLARLIETPDDEDGLVDLAGYAATLQILAGREPSV
jgi:hypothetical protein